jgi:hypothetical protein
MVMEFYDCIQNKYGIIFMHKDMTELAEEPQIDQLDLNLQNIL